MEQEKVVDYKVPCSIQIARSLRSKGFETANTEGLLYWVSDNSVVIGILYQDPNEQPVRHFFGLVKSKPRRKFLGTINLSPQNVESDWCINVYGEKNVEILTKLAKEISSEFNKKITVCLKTEAQYRQASVFDNDP